jgi:hypothetical protein
MNLQSHHTLDAMAFYKRHKELHDQGAPSFTFDSTTNLAQPGKVVYESPLFQPEAVVDGRYEAYYKADIELSERSATFIAANPNASFIETLFFLIYGVTIHDQANPSDTSGHNQPVERVQNDTGSERS